MAIKTRSTHFSRDVTEEQKQGRIQQMLVMHGHSVVADWKPKGKVDARLEANRWLADCPEEWCSGAELVDPSWPVFVCISCGVGPLSVSFPVAREKLEAELLKRPNPNTREWLPGETLKDLQRENKENGVS